MQAIKIQVGDLIVAKKKHPCSADVFKIMRVGSDVRITCTGCCKDMILPREKLEKMIKKVLPSDGDIT